jgi:hypothetical protein
VERTRAITADDAADIRRILDELRRRGPDAVPAIRDVLRRGENVDFAHIAGGDLVGHRTLRQAMIDTLATIGGARVVAVSLEELQRSTDPLEVFMLARIVERDQPGAHADQVIQAAGSALQSAARAEEPPDVGPLFDLLRAYRSEQAVALLEQSAPQWGAYALLALTGLPDGAGIPSMAALAARPDREVANRALSFQVLAQTSARYPAAGDALVELARAGELGDEAWAATAEALAGRQLRFSGRMFDGTPLAEEREAAPAGRSPLWRSYYVEWLNVRYEDDVVSADWSAEQVARQLALIDELTELASSPIAVEALQQARTSLLHARGDDDGSAAHS